MRPDNYELTVIDKPRSITTEAYRTLRTNLGFAGVDQAFRSMLISRPSPQDGKSTVIANLGVAMAQTGSRVLIVDCDLRKPVQHKIFGLDNQQGFTTCLVKELPLDEAVHETKTGVDSLRIRRSY